MEAFKQLMRQLPFREIEKTDCRRLLCTLEKRVLFQGARLMEQGKPIDHVGMLRSGSAHFIVRSGSGEETPCGQIHRGELFGELFFFAGGIAMASLVCPQPASCYLVDIDATGRIIDKYPAVKSYFYQIALKRLITIQSALNLESAKPALRLDCRARSGPIRRAMTLIEQNYMQPLTLPEVSKKIGVSPFHFSRTFRASTGYSFKAYLNQVRIEAAKKMMRAQEINVTETCFAVGFNDLSYFSRVFRKMEGISPSDYRRELREFNVSDPGRAPARRYR
jgi:AraC-like DNA-binding protein